MRQTKQLNIRNINIKKRELGFLGSGLLAQEQTYVRKQDYAYIGSCLGTLKTQKTWQNLKTEVLAT